MATRMGKALHELLNSKHSHLFLDSTLPAVFSKGSIWHGDSYSCPDAKSYRQALPTRPKTTVWEATVPIWPEATPRPIRGLLTGELCITCFGNLQYAHQPLRKHPEAGLVFDLQTFTRKAQNIGVVKKDTSASAVQKRLAEIEDLMVIADDLSKSSRECLRGDYKAALKILKESKAVLTKATTSDQMLAELERSVQRQLVPPKFRTQKFELDSTMMLIGISPTPAHYQGAGIKADTVKAIIDAYAIRKGESTVLYAPAYFYSYLLGNLFFKSGSDCLVVSASDPGDPESRENAAALWDPQNESVLACLSQATATGSALSGS